MPRIDNPDFEADGGFFQVAGGWHPFGGNKWESVWDPEHVFTQGIAAAIPSQGAAPLTVQFDGSASYDPDGDALSYEWDFGGGYARQSGAVVIHDAALMQWYDSLLKEDSYELGATIFSLVIHNWGDFDISGEVFELLTDYVRSSRLPTP